MAGFHDMVERTFPDDVSAQVRAVTQLTLFKERKGLFARPAAREAACSMAAHAFWQAYGATVPELQKVATRVLSQVRPFSIGFNVLILAKEHELMRKLVWHSGCIQPTGACACERNWSTYNYIHNKKRNRLVVFVFSNRRLLKKVQAIDYDEQCWSWAEEEEEECEVEEAAEEEEEVF